MAFRSADFRELTKCVSRALQYTADESKAVRCVTNEVHVYNPSNWEAGIADKVRLEGVTSVSVSPGQNPNVALFVAEKKARSIFPIPSLSRSDGFFRRAHPLRSKSTVSALSASHPALRRSTRPTKSR